ncbi:MAG: hypothetical protein V3R35_03510 [Woeseiaceae bacterium]
MNFLSSLSPHVHWGLRLSLAATFIYHGWVKFPIEGPMMGIPVAVIWLLALGEIAAGRNCRWSILNCRRVCELLAAEWRLPAVAVEQ